MLTRTVSKGHANAGRTWRNRGYARLQPPKRVYCFATPLTAVPVTMFSWKVLPCERHTMNLHTDCCGHVSAKQGYLHETFSRFNAGQLVVCVG
jgi:hypothetical protein